MEIIAQGAEAVLKKDRNLLIKERIRKEYRTKEIDSRLRNSRTKKEAKLIEKASSFIPVPKIHKFSNGSIFMEFINGKLLRDIFDELKQNERKDICISIGKQIAKLHDTSIIHGDLTTSNMILKDKKIYFIDFGLGFVSQREEDKAIDLHLLKQAIESKHYLHANSFEDVTEGYKDSNNFSKVLNRLKLVEKRGRYKRKR